MQQREIMSGFSDLKELLIRTYKIDKDREFVRLYFTELAGALLMQDYHDHKKSIPLCYNVKRKLIEVTLSAKAQLLIEESLLHPVPAKFLNDEFMLNGSFRF